MNLKKNVVKIYFYVLLTAMIEQSHKSQIMKIIIQQKSNLEFCEFVKKCREYFYVSLTAMIE